MGGSGKQIYYMPRKSLTTVVLRILAGRFGTCRRSVGHYQTLHKSEFSEKRVQMQKICFQREDFSR